MAGKNRVIFLVQSAVFSDAYQDWVRSVLRGCKKIKLYIYDSISYKIKIRLLFYRVKIQKIYRFLCPNPPKNQAVYQHIINMAEDDGQRA